MAESETTSATKPKDIAFSDIVVDIQFHPQKDVIASSSIEGDVFLHSYSSTNENSELMKLSNHKKSCRVIRFTENGEELHSASKDKSINTVDLNTGTLKRSIRRAHDSPIYSMAVTGENYLVTGDDDGHLKMWDFRQQEAVMNVRENEEFISDIVVDAEKKTLLTTSGDGTLTCFNLRRRKLEHQSELFDSEFLCLAIIKKRDKVVCGCGEGELNIFNWGEWGNISDRFPGHPQSVDCMLALTDDIVCTGSCDGMIRAVSILPNRFLGVVGEHPGELPVENITLSRDKHYLASCSHDQTIKFWDVQSVDDEEVDVTKKARKSDKNKYLKSAEKGDFFADMEAGVDIAGGNNSDEEDGDDDEEEKNEQGDDDDSDDDDSDDD